MISYKLFISKRCQHKAWFRQGDFLLKTKPRELSKHCQTGRYVSLHETVCFATPTVCFASPLLQLWRALTTERSNVSDPSYFWQAPSLFRSVLFCSWLGGDCNDWVLKTCRVQSLFRQWPSCPPLVSRHWSSAARDARNWIIFLCLGRIKFDTDE